MVTVDPGDEDYGYAVKQTYLYLRMSLVGVVIAIGLAVHFTPKHLIPEGQGSLPSISHYYYSPARIVFVAALCAAALALLALAGTGVQSYILDIGALLAPLIAIIPTPVKLDQVAAFDPACARPNDECIPKIDYEYMQLGFKVWLWLAGGVIAIGFVRAAVIASRRAINKSGPRVAPLFWLTLGCAAVAWIAYWWASANAQAWFNSNAHFTSAGVFFVLISLVAWIEVVRQWRRRPNSKVTGTAKRRYAWGYIATYAAIGLVLALDIIAAAIIILIQSGTDPDVQPLFAPTGVFVVEVIGLVFFAAFFAVQTFDHRHDGDLWGKLPPSEKQQRRIRPLHERAHENGAQSQSVV